jgi:hypothetical protein
LAGTVITPLPSNLAPAPINDAGFTVAWNAAGSLLYAVASCAAPAAAPK